MSSSSKAPAWLRTIDQATLFLAALSGICLVGMLVLVFVAVISRYVFSAPILGVNEIVQLTSVAVVMLAMPYCTDRGAHVSVDVLDNAIGATGRFIGDLLSRIVSAGVLSVLVYRAAFKAMDAHEFGDTTNMLALPLWPFYVFVSVGMALCVLVMLAQFVAIVVEKVRS